MGKVYLIGAGPGNEELVTAKALRVLKECTAVMYDRLAGDSLLRYLKDDCEIYYCGKEPGAHYKTQDEINAMLIELAEKGHTVGRIKGGDPYVFGRGGEEALALREKNIHFEVLPGITSAISVLNYAGIPITQRDVAQSFHVFTAMSADNRNLDWNTISKLQGTLVFLMGLDKLELITASLISEGMDKNMPVAVVMNGTRANQRKAIGTLETITQVTKEKGFKSPCIIAVGKVVELSEKLDWYSEKPLSGLNVCVTRSKAQAEDIKGKLFSAGAEVTEINSIEIQDTSENLHVYADKLKNYDLIIMNSVNSVKVFFNYLKNNKYDIRQLTAKFAAIGPATARSLEARGIVPEIVADEFIEESLFEKITENFKETLAALKETTKVLIPGSEDARGYVASAMKKLGIIPDEVAIYRPTLGKVYSNAPLKDTDIVLYTSPSTVKNMIALCGIDALREKQGLSIGPITKRVLDEYEIKSFVSDIYTTEGMLQKLIEIKDTIRRKV